MSAIIDTLKNKLGVLVYPKTLTKAVYDETTQDRLDNTLGTATLTTTAQNLKGAINEIKSLTTATKLISASQYSAASTYILGEYVIYNDVFYKCTTAITVAEPWTIGHWTATNLGNELSTTNTNLGTKAPQSALDATNANVMTNTSNIATHTNQIASLSSGSPKGVYATVSALTTAFPSGNANTYIVTADGKWYYWDSSAWTAGGTYQSTGVAEGSIVKNSLENMIKNCFDDSYVNQSLTFIDGSYVNADGTVLNGVNYSYASISVAQGDRFKISGAYYYNLHVYFFVSATNQKSYPSSSGQGYSTDLPFVAPENGTLYINNPGENYSMEPFVVKAEKLTSYKIANSAINEVGVNNPLYGKSMYSDGDSIAVGAVTGKSYVDFIAQNNSMSLTKSAVSGTTLTKRNGRTDSILERVKAMSGSYDYILLEGGTNDYFVSLPLGALTTGLNATLDESTVIGAVESMCKTLVTNYPTAKKLFILTHKLITSAFGYDANQTNYWNAIKSALEKWGISYIDFSTTGNYMMYNSDWLQNYFATGETMGTHPNELGYKTFYVPLIESKMKTI